MPTAKGLPEPKQVESMPKLRVVGNGVSVKSELWICLPFHSRFEHNYAWSPKSREITRMLFMAVGSTCFLVFFPFRGAVGAGRSWC